MGIEYFASVTLNQHEIAEVAERLAGDERFRILERSPGRGLLLRFTNHDPNEGWPEDVEIFFDEKLLVVCFGGSRQDREGLISVLDFVITSLGHSSALEED